MIDVWIWIGVWSVILIMCIVELWKVECRLAEDRINKMFEYLEKRKEDRELALKVLKSIKTDDVVDVVRCKDCKWFNDFGCAIRIVDETDKPKENDFCSFGERREE